MSVGKKRAHLGPGIIIFSTGKENRIINWEQVFFVHRRLVLAVKRIVFFSVMLSCIVLRGRWIHIISVNVHAPNEEKSEELKGIFVRN